MGQGRHYHVSDILFIQYDMPFNASQYRIDKKWKKIHLFKLAKQYNFMKKVVHHHLP